MVLGTALHGGKDLAVSLLHYCKTIPEGIHNLSVAGVSARTSMVTHDGRYPLPFSKHQNGTWPCPDFPPSVI